MEELITAQQTISELEGQLAVYRSEGSQALSDYDRKVTDFQSKILSSSKLVAELESRLSEQSAAHGAELAQHQSKIIQLEDSLRAVQGKNQLFYH